MFLVFVLALFLLLPAIICAGLAPDRGRSGGLWFVLGLIFGWVALLVLAVVPAETSSAETYRPQRHYRRPLTAEQLVVCPSCRSTVSPGGSCAACGEPLPEPLRRPSREPVVDPSWRGD